MSLPEFYSKFPKDISWISNRTIYLSLHGSRAYGTFDPITSDWDYKGVCIPPKEYLYSSARKFEQAILSNPDVVIYDLRKFFKLATECNPNFLESLFVDPEDIIYIDSLGEILLSNREMFLSKKVKHTFSGYASSQLHRIKTHNRFIINPPKTPPTRSELGLPAYSVIPQSQIMAVCAEIQKELDKFQFDSFDDLDAPTKINIQNTMTKMLAELKITSNKHWEAASRKIGLSDNLIEVIQREREYSNKKQEWEQYQSWKTHRTPARAASEEKYGVDLKNAYHLIRLIRMCREILTTGKVIVKRPDREELIAIRNGAWTYDQILEFADKEDKSLNELYLTSKVLPEAPDKEKIDALCIMMIEKSLQQG